MTAAGPASAMTVEELIERAQQAPLRLLLDTNAVFSHRRLGEICKAVIQLNKAGSTDISLLVSAVVHAEKLFDLRQGLGADYDLVHVRQAMKRRNLQVLPFDVRHADETAALLARSFPTRDDWREAKCKRCVDCLGLGQAGAGMQGKGKSCSATVDWLIAGHAIAEQCVLVTDDRGVEFREVTARVRADILKQALDRMLAQATAAPGQP